MATKFVVERYNFSSYQEVVRKTVQQCHDLQAGKNWISSVQIDTYLPYGRKDLKNVLPESSPENHWMVQVATSFFHVAEKHTRETSVVTIWYHKSPMKQGLLEFKLNVYNLLSHEHIAKDVAKELDHILESDKTLLTVNYDTYGSHGSEHSDSMETTAVAIFYFAGDHHHRHTRSQMEIRKRRGVRPANRGETAAGLDVVARTSQQGVRVRRPPRDQGAEDRASRHPHALETRVPRSISLPRVDSRSSKSQQKRRRL